MKPLIGITCNYETRDLVGMTSHMGTPGQDWNFLAGDYVYAVEKAGGIPVILPRCESLEVLQELIGRLDGILISGGHDVDPASYGEAKRECCGYVVPERDAMELSAIRTAMDRNLPLLAICRGIQILNAALGGTVWQDVQKEGSYECHSFGSSVSREQAVHPVSLAEGSLLHRIYGKTTVMVNSFHHQAVRTPAQDAVVTAVSPDGVTEAMELPGAAFAVAVQWHPEMMFDSAEQKKLFSAFVEACKKERERK